VLQCVAECYIYTNVYAGQGRDWGHTHTHLPTPTHTHTHVQILTHPPTHRRVRTQIDTPTTI